MDPNPEDKFIKNIGARLRELRLQKGKTQEDIAVLLNTDRSYVGKIENGKRDIRISYIFKFCQGLSIDIKELFISY